MLQLLQRPGGWRIHPGTGSGLACRLLPMFRLRLATIQLVLREGRSAVLSERLLHEIRRVLSTMWRGEYYKHYLKQVKLNVRVWLCLDYNRTGDGSRRPQIPPGMFLLSVVQHVYWWRRLVRAGRTIEALLVSAFHQWRRSGLRFYLPFVSINISTRFADKNGMCRLYAISNPFIYM